MALIKGTSMHSCLHSSPLRPKKMLIFNVNGMFCYFTPSTVLQGNAKVFGRNVDKTKMEVKVGVENFLVKAFEEIYVAIWSCMKLENVLKVLPMFMPENFLNWFVFIWGCE
jgi:hypothetical protein